MGCEGPTADTAVIAVSMAIAPIAKKREAIRGLPRLPRFNYPRMVPADMRSGGIVVSWRRANVNANVNWADNSTFEPCRPERRHVQFSTVQFIFEQMKCVILNAPLAAPLDEQTAFGRDRLASQMVVVGHRPGPIDAGRARRSIFRPYCGGAFAGRPCQYRERGIQHRIARPGHILIERSIGIDSQQSDQRGDG